MKINNKQNVYFQANYKLVKPEDAQNILVKKILPGLEACGGPNVTHEIKTNDDGLLAMILSTFRVPENPAFQVFKRLELNSPESISLKMDELRRWVVDRHHQAKM